MQPRPILHKLTLTWRFVLVLASALFLSTTAHAQAPLGPEAPATAADLDAIRGEMRQQAESAQRRLEADEAVIARLHEQLWAER
ncbi:MAG: hypothetical protein JWM53_6607, partial [bacterium]|nr:hypothetical protein [bacterium]